MASRLREVVREDARRVGEVNTCIETLRVEMPAGGGDAWVEDPRFSFFKAAGEADGASPVALRFEEVVPDDALRVGEVIAWVEIVEVPTGTRDTRLFGDGVSAKVNFSRAPLKLAGGWRSTSMAFSPDRINRKDVSATPSEYDDETELFNSS